MEGLRAQARDSFLHAQRSEGEKPETVIQLTTVRKYASGDTSVEEEAVRSTEILHRATQTMKQHQNQDVVASAQIVRIDQMSDVGFSVEAKTMMHLFEAFQLDLYFLQVFSEDDSGFYSLPRQHASSKSGKSHNFYLKAGALTLLWSYDSADASTKVLLSSLRGRSDFWDSLVEILCYHKDLFHESWFFLFVAGVYLEKRCNFRMEREDHRVFNIESETGHGWGSIDSSDHATTHKLAASSRTAGVIQANLAGIMNDVRLTKSLFKHLSSEIESSPKSKDLLAGANTILERRVDVTETDISLLQERVRIQQSVIFNLLGREDANLSREIATAAKKDTSAMKTIAVMTMAFLPGTFFAALFAVPLLQWQEEKVVDGRFWVYWAFTLPCTGLVFFIWWGLAFRGDNGDSNEDENTKRQDDEEGLQEKKRSRKIKVREAVTLTRRRGRK